MYPSDAGTRLWAEGNSAWSPPAHRGGSPTPRRSQLNGGQSTTRMVKEQWAGWLAYARAGGGDGRPFGKLRVTPR
jgi:hypothetical protein